MLLHVTILNAELRMAGASKRCCTKANNSYALGHIAEVCEKIVLCIPQYIVLLRSSANTAS